MSQYTERLKKMQGAVDEQMTDYVPGGFSLVPEGEYAMRVQATLDETKKEPKRLVVVWQFTVTEGDSEGRKVFDRTMIEDNKVGLQICRGRVEDLGWEWPARIVDLESVLEAINATPPMVQARVTHETSTHEGKEYTNARIRITEILETTAPAPADDTTPQAPPSEDAERDPTRDGLLSLCSSFGFADVNDSMDSEDIVKALTDADVKFPEKDLQPEELELLDNAAPDLIQRSEPEKPKRTLAKPATAPATKAAPATKKAAPVAKSGKR